MRRNRVIVGLVVALLTVGACGEPPASTVTSKPSRQNLQTPTILVRIQIDWSTKPKRHHDIELTLTLDGKTRPTLTAPWRNGSFSEIYSIRAGSTISMTADQQDDGSLNGTIETVDNPKLVGNSPQSRRTGGSITVRFTYKTHPA